MPHARPCAPRGKSHGRAWRGAGVRHGANEGRACVRACRGRDQRFGARGALPACRLRPAGAVRGSGLARRLGRWSGWIATHVPERLRRLMCCYYVMIDYGTGLGEGLAPKVRYGKQDVAFLFNRPFWPPMCLFWQNCYCCSACGPNRSVCLKKRTRQAGRPAPDARPGPVVSFYTSQPRRCTVTGEMAE